MRYIAEHLLIWLNLELETTPSVGENLEELELTYTTHGNVKWYRHFEKVWQLLKVKYIATIETSHFTLYIYSRER